MQAILILTAVDLEARALGRELELPAVTSLPFAAFGGPRIRLAVIGPGAGLLASRWPALIRGLDHPLVVSAGLCGGLDPALAPGDLVVPGRVAGPEGNAVDVSAPDHRRAREAAAPASTGLLVTARDVVGTPAAKAALFARTGAVAVDMESSFVLAAAADAGLPSLVVRGVSDGADESLPPELARLVSSEGRLRLAGAAALIARPAVLPRALGLRRASGRALRAVARALAALAA